MSKEDRQTGTWFTRRAFLKKTMVLGTGGLLLGFIPSALAGTVSSKHGINRRRKPVLDSDWWSVAGNPDLQHLNGGDNQQPVDFGVWQAEDGSWQLWSCIRHTREPGKTRLLYGWEGQSPEERDWSARGIQMQADPLVGETAGGLQAPHTIREADGRWHMFYGDWNAICRAVSDDGKRFRRVIQENQERVTAMFTEGAGTNTRDAHVIREGNTYYCYYTAGMGFIDEHAYEDRGAVYCRTSEDMKHWSDSEVVSQGGRAGEGWGDHECPHVVKVDGYFYLFRTQRYGEENISTVYCSENPLDFGVGADEGYFVTRLPVAAPELVQHQDQWYIFALKPGLDGIRVARLKWEIF